MPQSQWQVVNGDGQEKVKVVIFEGWCVGFRAWDDQTLREKWEAAVRLKEQDSNYNGRLGHVKFEDVKAVNVALRKYDSLTELVTLSDLSLRSFDMLTITQPTGCPSSHVSSFYPPPPILLLISFPATPEISTSSMNGDKNKNRPSAQPKAPA